MRQTTTPLRRGLTLAFAIALLAGCGTDGAGDDEPGAPAEEATDGDGAGSGPGGYGIPDREDRTDDATDDPPDDVAEDVTIEITDFAYDVPEAVPAGAEVTVTNTDGVGHTVTSDDELFDVAVDPGATVTFSAPDDPGEYGFFCIPHPHMTATLVVQ